MHSLANYSVLHMQSDKINGLNLYFVFIFPHRCCTVMVRPDLASDIAKWVRFSAVSPIDRRPDLRGMIYQ